MTSASVPFILSGLPSPLPPSTYPIRESVADIVETAHRRIASTWNKNISLGALLRSYESTVLHQGAVYVSEGDYVQGYLYLYMFAEFAISWIKEHPDRTKTQYKTSIRRVQELCANVILPILAELKPLINEAHDRYTEQRARAAKRLQQIKSSPPRPPATFKAEQDKEQSQVGFPQSRQQQAEREELWDLQKQIQGIKLVNGRPQVSDTPVARTKMEFNYPLLAQQRLQESRTKEGQLVTPAKADLTEVTPKVTIPETVKPPTPHPTPPPVTEQESKQFGIGSYLENGQGLRTVFIPSTLREVFLKIAEQNTRHNLETCGILCGVLRQNAFIISYLLIPPQIATPNSCTTQDEESIFDFQDKNSLLTLGWIHTHPTQTCFMSSLDLHTHLGYQIMLPEAIAIVCAPSKQPSWGVFRLTDPPGVKTLTDCHQKETFHPHDIPGESIYRDCWRGSSDGHVREMPGAKLEIVDLRK